MPDRDSPGDRGHQTAEFTAGWFDAHVIVGAHPEQPAVGPDQLHDHLRRYRFSGAMVEALASWLHDPLTGNAEASAAAEKLAELGVRPCWTAVPPTPGELGRLTDLVQEAEQRDVAAFRLFPQTHGYSITDPVWSPFFAELATRSVPLCLNRTEVSWHEIGRIADDHPDLLMIISLVGYRELRVAATMLARHRGLHLDLVNFAAHQGLEWLVEHYGSSRMLFATGFGLRDPGESLARLAWSDLSTADKHTIGSSNGQRLLGVRS